MAIFTIYIVGILMLILTWKVCQWIKYCSEKNIPGPCGLPFVGSVFSIHPEKMHLTFYKWALKYGRIFRVKMFGQTVIVLNDFELVRKLFADREQIDFFNDRPETFVGKFAVFETSDIVLSLENNEKFVTLKRILQKCLKRQSSTDNFQSSFNAEMNRLEEMLDNFGGEDFEMNPLIRSSLANLVSILMSGEGVDIQKNSILWEFNDNSFYLLETSVNLFLSTFPFARYIPGRIGTVYKRMILSRDWIIKKYFDNCKSVKAESGEKGLVYALLKEQCKENNKRGNNFITDEIIKGMILDLIVAAMKTTNSAVSASFLLLLNNPKYIYTIQNEIDEVVGQARQPEVEDQAKMPFCRAFVYEMLRYTSFGSLGLPHLVTKDYKVGEYQFRKDDICLSNIWYIHHDPHFWDRPWDFCPSRFLDDDGLLLPPGHEKMRTIATFSVGRRVCVGKDIAFDRIFLYLTNILQKFTLLPPVSTSLPNADPTDFLPGLIQEPKKFSCRFLRRNDIEIQNNMI